MYFCFNEFEVGVNASIFFGNEQQKVYLSNLLVVSETCCWGALDPFGKSFK